jgi:hypothetical protein
MVGLGIYIFIAKNLSNTVGLMVAMVAVEGT